MKRTIVPLVAAVFLLSGAPVYAQIQSTEAATPEAGEIPSTSQTEPESVPEEGTGESRVAPPVNPLPSYYAMNKPRPPGVGDGGIAPPINPVPAPTVDPSAFNAANRFGGK